MSAYPSLPLFTDAFIADTGHLSAQETGAYMMLLMVAWRSPACRLPDDDDKLARWARVDRRTWLRIKRSVMEFWTLIDGAWTQKRLSKEREIVSKRADAARENGKQGGRPKSLKNDDPPNPAGSAGDSQSKAPNPSPNPSRIRVEPPESLPEKPEPDTRTAASRSVPETSRYFFESGVIRLNEVDFRKWEAAFPNVGLRAELTGLAGWAAEQPNWFFAVPGALAKRDREARLAVERIKAETIARANAPKPKACGYVP